MAEKKQPPVPKPVIRKPVFGEDEDGNDEGNKGNVSNSAEENGIISNIEVP